MDYIYNDFLNIDIKEGLTIRSNAETGYSTILLSQSVQTMIEQQATKDMQAAAIQTQLTNQLEELKNQYPEEFSKMEQAANNIKNFTE